MQVYNVLVSICVIAACMECFLYRFNKVKIGNIVINKRKYSCIISVILMILLFVVSALRSDTVGTDLVRYIPRFNTISNSSWNSLIELSDKWSFEYGFTFFCKLISYISNDYRVFLVMTSAVVCAGFLIGILCLSKMPVMSILVFLCYGYWGSSMNIIRQSMAMAILFCALVQITKNKKVKAMILICLATLLQSTSILYLIILLLSKKKFQKREVILLSILTGVLFFIPKSFIAKIISFTSFGWYSSNEGSGLTTLMVLVFITILVYLFKNKIKDDDANIDTWMWFLSISILANVLALKIGIFERVMRLFLLPLMIIMPDLILVSKRYKVYIYAVMGCIVSLILYFYIIIMRDAASSGGIIPYLVPFGG
ncbi:Transmembrane protein EpsG [Terrisporobacter petrolearius]|uniref:EpsG family protein n=1 Tax=Terrisporobacter petrolearius TaxID=1460447 RepID=UPI0033672B2B